MKVTEFEIHQLLCVLSTITVTVKSKIVGHMADEPASSGATLSWKDVGELMGPRRVQMPPAEADSPASCFLPSQVGLQRTQQS